VIKSLHSKKRRRENYVTNANDPPAETPERAAIETENGVARVRRHVEMRNVRDRQSDTIGPMTAVGMRTRGAARVIFATSAAGAVSSIAAGDRTEAFDRGSICVAKQWNHHLNFEYVFLFFFVFRFVFLLSFFGFARVFFFPLILIR
jgi:hypothetical protein